MTTFLDRWSFIRNREPREFLDPSFIALGYNRLCSSGCNGTVTSWLFQSVAEYGVIPLRAEATEDVESYKWISGWKERHKDSLYPAQKADRILNATYRHPHTKSSFTGAGFLKKEVGIDFRDFYLVENMDTPEYENESRGRDTTRYRERSFKRTEEHLKARRNRLGISRFIRGRSADMLTRAVTRQLDKRWPVLAAIRTDFTAKNLYDYTTITAKDLVSTGSEHYHSGVFVAHCKEGKVSDPLCEPFLTLMNARKISDCMLFQSSWGLSSHLGGFVCIAPEAFPLLLEEALVLRTELDSGPRP